MVYPAREGKTGMSDISTEASGEAALPDKDHLSRIAAGLGNDMLAPVVEKVTEAFERLAEDPSDPDAIRALTGALRAGSRVRSSTSAAGAMQIAEVGDPAAALGALRLPRAVEDLLSALEQGVPVLLARRFISGTGNASAQKEENS